MHAPLPPRHYCRNPHCRSKLPAPVENEHRAFCCRGCFENFYRARCRVCERTTDTDPMTGAKRAPAQNRQKFCGRRCKAEAAKFPHIYAWELPPPTKSPTDSRSAHFTGLKIGLTNDRPAPISGPVKVVTTEVFPTGYWHTVASSDGVVCEVHNRRSAP